MTDLTILADDDLNDMLSDARAELNRRKEGKKLPVFAVDGTYYKSLNKALEQLERKVQHALTLADGADLSGFGMSIEFWNEIEYNARPDEVWGVLLS